MVIRAVSHRLAGCMVGAMALGCVIPAHAQVPVAFQANSRHAQIVVDADTFEIIYEENARSPRRPASITKVMTLYLLFDALKSGQLSWNDRITFSRFAAAQPPTKLGVGAGGSISMQTAIEALVVRSANDVAAAVGETIAGSEPAFARLMTEKARELGMSNTTFGNASGLPHPRQFTTAEDLARLAIAVRRDFPDQYHWFSTPEFTYAGVVSRNHNHLMRRMPGMDGLKTGYTRASGFNLAASTSRNGRRIITVVLGGANRFQRDDLVEALTETAFSDLGISARYAARAASPYDSTFYDPRDAADAAALIMDSAPPRPSVVASATTSQSALGRSGFNRSGRTLGFDRVAVNWQASASQSGSPVPVTFGATPTGRQGTPAAPVRDDAELVPEVMSEEEAEAVPPPANAARALPHRGTVRTTPSRPVAVPVPVPSPVPVPTVVTTPIQMAMATPGATPSPRVVVPTPAAAQPVPPRLSTLRGTLEPVPGETPANSGEHEAQPEEPDRATAYPRTQLAELFTPPPTMPASGQSQDSPNDSDDTLPATLPRSPVAMGDDNPDADEAAATPRLTQMAVLEPSAVAAAQAAQLAASAREQERLEAAVAAENLRKAELAAKARQEREARQKLERERVAARQMAERQAAERTRAEQAAKQAQEAREAAAEARLMAAREERERQEALTKERNARGNAVVQVGAFKVEAEARQLLASLARNFPSFAQRQVTTVTRKDGVWYRARFAGLGAAAAREACRKVTGRGGACQIISE
jgi:D-alanyl-D-alanine carboxypeptidase